MAGMAKPAEASVRGHVVNNSPATSKSHFQRSGSES